VSLFLNLKRRGVFRVGGAYVVVAWLIAQGLELVFNSFPTPDWVLRTVLVLLAVGLPIVLIIAWAFEITPGGIKRQQEEKNSQISAPPSHKKLDRIIIGVLILVLGYFAYDKFFLSTSHDATLITATMQTVAGQGVVAPQAVTGSAESIAVLPFVNMSDDASNEYFSDGISEELLNLLTKIPKLRVIARTSSFAYKNTDVKISEVARELDVEHVLEGSVRKAGDQVRITAQLIRASDSSHLWSETFDRRLDNIFAIQDEIASAVVDKLRITLMGAIPTAQISDPKAYTLYLEAQQLGHQKSAKSLEHSSALYKKSLVIDPDNSAAWSGLDANNSSIANGGVKPIAQSKGGGQKVISKGWANGPVRVPADVESDHAALNSDYDPQAEARRLRRVLALEPDGIEALRSVVTLYRYLGRLDDAIAILEYVVTLDSANSTDFYWLGLMNRYSGSYDAAIATFQAGLSLDPGQVGSEYGISMALLLKGESEAALQAIQKEEYPLRATGDAMIFHALGQADESDAALVSLIGEQGQGAAYNIASVQAFRGEPESAFKWLGKAVQYNSPGLTDLLIEPLFINLHDDSRWVSLLQSIGRSPEQLAAIDLGIPLPD